MKVDIQQRSDIEKIVNAFYEKIKTDEVIGYFFNDVAKVNWEVHLPKMYDFWESIIFQREVYAGNPLLKHFILNKKSPLTVAHFEHWYSLFEATIDELYEGENTNFMKQRARNIATLMPSKILD
jgi:hemoglobin